MNDLELRCLKFAKDVRDFCKALNFDTINTVYIKQIIRSSSSIGANYIEANEKLGKQDLQMRLKIARKEAKETVYWLDLIESIDEKQRLHLKDEAEQLRKILTTIINNIQLKQVF